MFFFRMCKYIKIFLIGRRECKIIVVVITRRVERFEKSKDLIPIEIKYNEVNEFILINSVNWKSFYTKPRMSTICSAQSLRLFIYLLFLNCLVYLRHCIVIITVLFCRDYILFVHLL